MADLGAACLWMGLALAAYSFFASIGGQLRGSPALVDSGRKASYVLVVVLLVSTLSLVQSFIARDFSLQYVAEHSNLAMPNIYTWVAFYAGNEGSLLYIAFALSVMAALAIWLAPASTRPTLAWTTAILMLIEVFFLAVMGFMANPFAKLPFPVPDGQGINPLLTHFGMFFHPPALMAGLVGISIPMAFSLGNLIGGRGGDEWIDAGRAWGVGIWALLAAGLLLGSWWAYTILGWGGFWFWDPVENAAFMPWIALTAFVHSIMVQKRRGMFRMWNIVLIDVAFGLALYGMFMNRGGPVPSVHSFGASTLGWVFLLFLAFGVIVPLAIFFWRYDRMKSAQSLDSMLSRESAFLVNNLLLLGIAFATLWGTVYPLLSRLFAEQEITVARPFYDQVNGPLMLGLVLLMGVGPLLPWRRANLRSLQRALLIPGVAALVNRSGNPAGRGHPAALRSDRFRPVRPGNSQHRVRVGAGNRRQKAQRGRQSGRWFRAADPGQPAALWRLRRAPGGGDGRAGRGRAVVLWHPTRRCADAGRVGDRGGLHAGVRGHRRAGFRRPHRVPNHGRGVPGRRTAGDDAPTADVPPSVQHGFDAGGDTLHAR